MNRLRLVIIGSLLVTTGTLLALAPSVAADPGTCYGEKVEDSADYTCEGLFVDQNGLMCLGTYYYNGHCYVT